MERQLTIVGALGQNTIEITIPIGCVEIGISTIKTPRLDVVLLQEVGIGISVALFAVSCRRR